MAGRPKGIPKTGGRRKGSVNRTTAELKDLLLQSVYDAGGRAYLKWLSRAEPSAYASLVGKLIPRDMKLDVPDMAKLADSLRQANERAAKLRSVV